MTKKKDLLLKKPVEQVVKEKEANFKVSKIMLWPSMKVNLGNYQTVDLNAGIEMVFDIPVKHDSPEIKEAYKKAREMINEEFNLQYAPYKRGKKVEKKEEVRNEG